MLRGPLGWAINTTKAHLTCKMYLEHCLQVLSCQWAEHAWGVCERYSTSWEYSGSGYVSNEVDI